MFAVIIEGGRRMPVPVFLKRLMALFEKPRIKQLTLSGISFLLVETVLTDGLFSSAVAKTLKRLGVRQVILGDGVKPPDGFDIRVINPAGYFCKMLFDAAVEIADHAQMPLVKKRCILVDRNGVFCRNLERLVKHFFDLTVITQRPYVYNKYAADLNREYGVMVNVLADIGGDVSASLIIDPYSQLNPPPLNCVTLSVDAPSAYNTAAFGFFAPDTEPQIFAGCPLGVEPRFLEAALATAHPRSGLRDKSPKTAVCGGEIVKIAKAGEIFVKKVEKEEYNFIFGRR